MRPASLICTGLMRRLALDRNELRRPSDRIESWCALALMIGFVPLAVLSATWAASSAHAAGAKEARDRPVRQVTAVLVQSAPAAVPVVAGSAVIRAEARWTVGGTTHVGDVPVIAGTQAGMATRIWVDATGQVEQPPPTAAQVTARLVLAIVSAPFGVAVGLWLAWYAVKSLLDGRRMASWAHEWSSLGPSWTR
jgi:hypothetical protein